VRGLPLRIRVHIPGGHFATIDGNGVDSRMQGLGKPPRPTWGSESPRPLQNYDRPPDPEQSGEIDESSNTMIVWMRAIDWYKYPLCENDLRQVVGKKSDDQIPPVYSHSRGGFGAPDCILADSGIDETGQRPIAVERVAVLYLHQFLAIARLQSNVPG